MLAPAPVMLRDCLVAACTPGPQAMCVLLADCGAANSAACQWCPNCQACMPVWRERGTGLKCTLGLTALGAACCAQSAGKSSMLARLVHRSECMS